MVTFIAIAAAAALVTGLILVLPLVRNQGDAPGRADLDTALFRDQLAEIDRDLERGTISAGEAEGAKAEISRRLLNAAKLAESDENLGRGPRMSSGMVAGLSLMAVPLVAAGLYLAQGAPGAPDLPFAERSQGSQATFATAGTNGGRPSQEQAEASRPATPPNPAADTSEYAALVTRLEERIAATPNDTRGLRLLGTSYMRLERYGDAWRVFDKLIGILGAEAEADLYAQMAEGMVLSAGGYVSPEAEQVIGMALERDRKNEIARYYAGLSLTQNGMIPEAIRVWQELRAEASPDAPWLPWLDQMLAQALEFQGRGMAGIEGGPSPDEIAAAEGLSAEDRQLMVNDMVQRLEDRIRAEGGTAQEYAQLIASRNVLNEPEKALEALAMAREDLTGGDLAAVEARAVELGIIAGDATAATTPSPGPTAEDIEAAGQMPAAERQEMILGMVARLEDRLLTEGGDGEQWFRLMNSYVQLGKMDDAARVYALSQDALKGQDAGFMKEQALVMGIITQ